jgi:hypothetical protein
MTVHRLRTHAPDVPAAPAGGGVQGQRLSLGLERNRFAVEGGQPSD